MSEPARVLYRLHRRSFLVRLRNAYRIYRSVVMSPFKSARNAWQLARV